MLLRRTATRSLGAARRWSAARPRSALPCDRLFRQARLLQELLRHRRLRGRGRGPPGHRGVWLRDREHHHLPVADPGRRGNRRRLPLLADHLLRRHAIRRRCAARSSRPTTPATSPCSSTPRSAACDSGYHGSRATWSFRADVLRFFPDPAGQPQSGGAGPGHRRSLGQAPGHGPERHTPSTLGAGLVVVYRVTGYDSTTGTRPRVSRSAPSSSSRAASGWTAGPRRSRIPLQGLAIRN